MIKFQTLLYFATLLSIGASYRILEEGNKEVETEEQPHVPIPVFETETKEPVPIPVDTFGEMIQAGKYNNIDFEMMEDLNIEWPVKSPDPEEIRQLKLESKNMLDDRIVNGEHVEITDRPFQVYIGGCGGSLVDPNWILTAAHCIYNDNNKVPKNSWKVRAGSSHQGSGGETRYVGKNSIKIHPQWTGAMSHGFVDLALMHIDEPFTESSNIKLIPMNDQYPDLKGQIATMSGWGKTEKTDRPDYLSQTTSQIVMDGDDQYGMGVLRMKNTAGSGICQGDSGGPATINSGGTTILAGVASYVWEKCGPGINGGFGTYTYDAANFVDINKYMDWIKETMKETPDCGNELPAGYTCSLTCEQWADRGSCDSDWSEFSTPWGKCFNGYGKVKDTCKLSCGKCAPPPAPIDCEWDDWQVGECDKSCGGGFLTKTRVPKVDAQHGGEECTGHSSVTESCNIQECPEIISGCNSNQFRCANGSCIPTWYRYDWWCDCSDCSDEF